MVDGAGRAVLDGVDLAWSTGSVLGLVGESGSGKTTLSLALLGHVRPGLRRAGGRVEVAGVDVFSASTRARQELRRRRIAYVGQDPGGSLTPTMRVESLVAERGSVDVARALAAVQLPSDRDFRRRFPHQLSGGQQQRLALARALAGRPDVLVLDEPTTSLDAVTQDLVLSQVEKLQRERPLCLLVVSHDLAVVARMADQVAVLQAGRIVDRGPTAPLLGMPSHAYTARLVAACPDHRRRPPVEARPPWMGAHAGDGAAVLAVENLTAGYHYRGGPGPPALVDVSFSLGAGDSLAVIGASGSGKTTLARCLVGLHRPDRGSVLLAGQALDADARRRSVRQRRAVQLVAQDPQASLNPRRSVGAALARPLRRLGGLDRAAAAAEVSSLLQRVRLDAGLADRRPSELSGGERQRVAIARALAARPEVLVCDEVTSALDVSVQAELLELLAELRRDLGLALVFITHDLGVASRVADRAIVLSLGRVQEEGSVSQILDRPTSPTTQALVAAAPSLHTALAARGAARPTT